MPRGFFGKLGKFMGSDSSRERNMQRNTYYPPQDYGPPYDGTYQSTPSHSSHSQSPSLSRNISFQNPPPYSGGYPPQRNMQSRYARIADNYNSLPEVTEALAQSGLESSNLIVGIDFTKSNEWTGKKSFGGLSLHNIGALQNPYEHAISIIGRTLCTFDEDNLIPCYGFGDAKTHDRQVFNFYPDGRPCNGFEEALSRYREIVPDLRLSGPTSFAPIIEMAMTIVEQSGGQYHVLLIIADGQVTSNSNSSPGQLSYQEQKTVEAIVRASQYPLSIVLVGVGDGPWEMMEEFDDNIPHRSFDNFQFVNFTKIMAKQISPAKKETEFALAALMEIPFQYKATLELGILGRPTGRSPQTVALAPPGSTYRQKASNSSYSTAKSTFSAARPDASGEAQQICPVCFTDKKNMAFGCGHQTCERCSSNLDCCPICREHISTRIRLY